MTKKNRWQVVPVILTIALVACEEPITGIPEPVVEAAVEAAPPVEAVTSVASSMHTTLISRWSGDDGFKDSAGDNDIVRDGGGVTATSGGVKGKAFLFPGTGGQFLEIDDDPMDLRPDEYTIELWAQRLGAGEDPTFDNTPLIQKANKEEGFFNPGLTYFIDWSGDVDWNSAPDVDENNEPIHRITADAAFAPTPATTDIPAGLISGPVPDDEWVHVALTVAALAAPGDYKTTLYVNGLPTGDFTTKTGKPFYGDGSIVVGNFPIWVRKDRPFTFNGCIDEIGIHSGALTATEIMEIYGSGNTNTCGSPDNAPPSQIQFEGAAEINEGAIFGPTVSFSDDGAGPWTVHVNYGDPDSEGNDLTFDVTDMTFDLSHRYFKDGEYTVTVTVTDDEGAEDSSFATVVVNNVSPTIDSGPDDATISVFEGETYESTVSFTDDGDDSWRARIKGCVKREATYLCAEI